MPITLQARLALAINEDVLRRVNLFENTSVGFLRMLSLVVQPMLFLPEEYVVRKGDIGSEMFIIHRGTVAVVGDEGLVQ